jgi:hypothetical protein
MSKIKEQMHYDEQDDKIIIQETHNFSPILDQTATLRYAGMTDYGDSKLVGVIPMKLWAEWGKKWGVKASDNEAMKAVVARELADPDNALFRVWGGTY